MNRREVLGALAAAGAAPFLAPLSPDRRIALAQAVHDRIVPGRTLATLSHAQNALVTRLANLILPETDTPGAASARVNEFIDLLLTDWYAPDDRDRILAGLAEIDARCVRDHQAAFVDMRDATQLAVMESLDGAEHPERPSAEDAFRTVKSLTIYGYFTSEVITRDVLDYQVIPGRYDGCAPR